MPPPTSEVRLPVPSSESVQLIRRLLEEESKREGRRLAEAIDLGYGTTHPRIEEKVNRMRKLEAAIQEVRLIQAFHHDRRVAQQRERRSAG